MNQSKSHMQKLLDTDFRYEYRSKTEYRPVSVEYGTVKTAEGSATVKIGETEVIAGIKLEIGQPYPDTPDQGSIMVNVELLPLSNPEFETGPPGIYAIELSRVVDRGIRESKCIDFKKLCIEPGEKAWILIIDICPINASGNLFDASSLAAMAALKDLRFPKYENDQIQYKEKTDKGLTLNVIPISVTVLKLGKHYIIDPNEEEEKLMDARLSVASIEDETLCALQKGGTEPLSVEDIKAMVDLGVKKAKELRSKL